jgi:hypothetical protein
MTINLNTTILAAQTPEVAVAGQPFSAGTPVFRRLDGKAVPMSGSVTIAQASQQNVTASPAIKSDIIPNGSAGNSVDYYNRMVEAGGMLFMAYRSNTGDLRTCWASKDGTLSADLPLQTGSSYVSDVVTDGANIAVIAIVGTQLKIFFFNAALRTNGSNGQVLVPLTISGATANVGNNNHVFDPVSGYLYCGWLTSAGALTLTRIHVATGTVIPSVPVATGVGPMYVHLQSRTRSFDMELFGAGQVAVVYKSTVGDLNFAVYDPGLVAVGATKTATAASIGTLGSNSTFRICALGDDKVCWGTQTSSKAVLFAFTNAGTLTSLLTVAVSAQRSAVMGRLADGKIVFAFTNDSATMDLSILKPDGSMTRRGATVVNSVAIAGSHLIVPFNDRFLLLASGAGVYGYGAIFLYGYGAIFLNDGTPVSQTKLTYSGSAPGSPDSGWSACKLSASGNAVAIHGTFFRSDADYNYYTSVLLSVNQSGGENYRYFFSNETTIPVVAGQTLVGDGMQVITFGQNGSGQHCLTRLVFEQCVFIGIAGSHCPNVGDLSYVFGKGTYRISHPNVTFNYAGATPIVGAKGNVSSGVLTLN